MTESGVIEALSKIFRKKDSVGETWLKRVIEADDIIASAYDGIMAVRPITPKGKLILALFEFEWRDGLNLKYEEVKGGASWFYVDYLKYLIDVAYEDSEDGEIIVKAGKTFPITIVSDNFELYLAPMVNDNSEIEVGWWKE